MRKSRVCPAPSYSQLWALHFTHFISSVVALFEVDKLKPRERKQLLLVTQLVGGRVRTEPRHPEPLPQASRLQHPCCPGPCAHWCWWGTLASALAQFSVQDALTLHLHRVFFPSTLASGTFFHQGAPTPCGLCRPSLVLSRSTFPADAEAVGGLHLWAAVAQL